MKAMTLSSLAFSAAILVLHQTPSLRAQAVAYDPTADFSITNGNPNGVWSYGWMPADLSLFSLDPVGENRWHGPCWSRVSVGEPVVWKNTTGSSQWNVPPGWLTLHPGPGGEASVLRWTAPNSGAVRLEGQFLSGDSGAMQVAIRLNNQPWWSAVDSGDFSLATNALAGNTVDFIVYGGYSDGNTPLTVLISMISPFGLHLARADQTNNVSFTAPAGGAYVLQFADNLTLPIQWMDVSTNVLSANQFFIFTHSPTNAAGFYRCRRD